MLEAVWKRGGVEPGAKRGGGWGVEGRLVPVLKEIVALVSLLPALHVPRPGMLFLLFLEGGRGDLFLQMKQSSPGEVICPKPCSH